jgi:hypothetical protein
MAKRPRKPKPEEARGSDGPPSRPSRPASFATSVLPMQLQVGDRFTDETGEWEIASPPFLLLRQGGPRPSPEGR